MRILYLVEVTANIWGGVRSALEDANALHLRDHEVTVLSKTAAPTWMRLDCAFATVEDFEPHNLPESDVVIAVSLEAAPFAAKAGKGIPIHYVQGYEGGDPQWASLLPKIEAIYGLATHKICISDHLEKLIQEKFAQKAHRIPYFVDHKTCYPAAERKVTKPFRVGLVGPYDLDLKDIRTGIEACALASRAGLDLQLVRVTNTQPHPDEQGLAFPVEWHQQVPPANMGDIYRSLDVFLGTSRGQQEGFFLPAVEAMACGIPAVLTDTPFHRGYSDLQYALFVDPMSPVQMAEGIVLAATNLEARATMRDAGIETAKRYQQDAHLEALETVLEDLLATHRPTPSRPETVPMQELQVSNSLTDPEMSTDDLDQLKTSIAASLTTVASTHTRHEQYSQAAEMYRAALIVRPDDLHLTQKLAYAHYLAGDDDKSLDLYGSLANKGVLETTLFSNRGFIHFSRGNLPAAIADFETAIRNGDQSAETRNNLGVARFKAGDHEGAQDAFQQALAVDPSHPDANTNLQGLVTA